MQRTPFYPFHVEHGAKFVDFAGWEMPILYRGIHEEHHQVRRSAGLFDVSHMGRIAISGVDARSLLERVLTRYVSDMQEGQCRYSLVCSARGGVHDDVIVYRYESHWMLVVNASNREKIWQHLQQHAAGRKVKLEDQTLSTAMVAFQGPKVIELIEPFSHEIPGLKRYQFCVKNLMFVKFTVSRTGYTGEDGVEVILPAMAAGMALKLLLKNAPDESDGPLIAPAGLGARDTLRLEAGMPLYGHELSEEMDPLSAGLSFGVTLDKDQRDGGEPFIGQEALKKIAADGPARHLTGLRLEGKRTARQGMPVLAGDKKVGLVTSACLSPTLGYPIAMAYVDRDAAPTAVELSPGKPTPAEAVKLPFYKKK